MIRRVRRWRRYQVRLRRGARRMARSFKKCSCTGGLMAGERTYPQKHTGTHARPQNQSRSQRIDEVERMILLQLGPQFHRKPREKIHSPLPNPDRGLRPIYLATRHLAGESVCTFYGEDRGPSMARIGRFQKPNSRFPGNWSGSTCPGCTVDKIAGLRPRNFSEPSTIARNHSGFLRLRHFVRTQRYVQCSTWNTRHTGG